MEKVIKITGNTMRYGIFFAISIILTAPLIGTLFTFANIKWSYPAWIITVVLSVAVTYFLGKTSLFKFENGKELIAYIVVGVVSVLIFARYSPVLELRQDPSLYMFKAMNLVNYGTTYMPMDIYTQLCEDGVLEINSTYAGIQNGTQMSDGNLCTDFYPGGTYVYAMIGLVSKRLMFFGQSIIMILAGFFLAEAVKRLTKKMFDESGALMVCAFMSAPLIVWFGRGSYSEPISLLYVLVIGVLLSDAQNIKKWLIMLAILSSYSARIDYVLVAMISIFVLCQISVKWSLATAALMSVEIYIFSKEYWIYYNRITQNDMPILKYSIPLVILAWAAGALIKRYCKKFESFYHSKVVYIAVNIYAFVLAMLVFRDNFTSEYEEAVIHGNQMRTYVENIMDLLSMTFPSIIILGGLFGLHRLTKNKELPIHMSMFFAGITAAYSYFFLQAGNSPQLYWMLRRYYNVLIPMLFIGFILLIQNIERTTKIIIALVCLIISVNMTLNSEQIREYAGLDKSAFAIDDALTNDGVEIVLYDVDMRYQASSIMSVSSKQFVPVSADDIESVALWLWENGYDNFVFLTTTDYGVEYEAEYCLQYIKLGETYGAVPTDSYSMSYTIYRYNAEEMAEITEATE